MKQGMSSLTDLVREVERQAALKKDFRIQTQALSLTGGNTLRIKGNPQEYTVSDHMHSQIAARLDIPAKYYNRMRKENTKLLDVNVNEWLTNDPETRIVRTLDGTARAFLSDRYRRRDHVELLEYILPDMLEGMKSLQLEMASVQITERKLYIKFMTPGLEGEVAPGDIVRAGGIISNSEIGEGYLEAYPYVLRKICWNGAVMEQYGQRKAHVGKRISSEEEVLELYSDEALQADDKAFWLKVRDSVRLTVNEEAFDKLLGKMRQTTQAKITKEPQVLVEELAQRYSFTNDEQGSILTNLINQGLGATQWGLANAITAVANDAVDYDRATELERFGGQIIELPATEWKAMAA